MLSLSLMVRNWGFLFLVFFYSQAQSMDIGIKEEKKKFHLVFDLDGTLVFKSPILPLKNHYELTKESSVEVMPDFILCEEKYYFAHGALEMLAFFSEKKFQISFFSNGTAARNKGFLKKMRQLLKKRFDCSALKKAQMYSRDAMTPLGKKNLDVFTENGDPIVLIEDNAHMILADQIQKVLLLRFDTKDRIENPEPAYSEKDQRDDLRLKNNLIRATGVLLQALDQQNPSSALFDLQWPKKSSQPVFSVHQRSFDNGLHLFAQLFSDRDFSQFSDDVLFYRRGLKALQEVNPSLDFFVDSSAFSEKVLFPF